MNITIDEAKDALRSRADGCFLCRWTLQDLERHGKLTNHPPAANLEKPLFPAEAKIEHLKLEKIST